jgi:hypothetical protein
LDAYCDVGGAFAIVHEARCFWFPLDPIANGDWKHGALTVGITLVR